LDRFDFFFDRSDNRQGLILLIGIWVFGRNGQTFGSIIELFLIIEWEICFGAHVNLDFLNTQVAQLLLNAFFDGAGLLVGDSFEFSCQFVNRVLLFLLQIIFALLEGPNYHYVFVEADVLWGIFVVWLLVLDEELLHFFLELAVDFGDKDLELGFLLVLCWIGRLVWHWLLGTLVDFFFFGIWDLFEMAVVADSFFGHPLQYLNDLSLAVI
jgi:hypothetical protein